MKLRIFLLLLLFNVFRVQGQGVFDHRELNCDEQKGIEYGGYAGMYFAGPGSAAFYSGHPNRQNNVEYVLRNRFWYNEIYQLLGAHKEFFVTEDGYPENPKYDPAFTFGLFVRYALNCKSGFILQFHHAKVNMRDVVVFDVDPPIDYLAEHDLRLIPIIGEEERNMLDIGYTRSFGENPTFRWFAGGGLHMNNTMVKRHFIRFEDKDYNLVDVYGSSPYYPGTMEYIMRQGGIGFGLWGTAGARMNISQAVALEPGINVYIKQIALEDMSGIYPAFSAYVRLCLRDFLIF